MKKLFILLFFYLIATSYGPPNCTLFEGDCQKACHMAEQAIQYGQGSKRSQQFFDRSIELCPTFDYSYYEKSVPYAKRGDIVEWKKLIDKAVELEPTEHLANRGWYHFFFLNNYEGAIADIEKLDSLRDYDIGATGDAIYHLNILRAICYDEIGQLDKALGIMESQMNDSTHFVSLYDYICLGVLYLKSEQYDKAVIAFEKQEKENDLAENHFYKAKAYLKLNRISEAKQELKIADEYYKRNRQMENGYRELPFEIYQIDIANALAELN
ncbi:MAG: hypothetical protein JKY48_19090 [Flavobacteriales bacterium]|nr:hypothetical protein [Flavobacteriales bacterium]